MVFGESAFSTKKFKASFEDELKKKKKAKGPKPGSIYTKERMDADREAFQAYLDTIQTYTIIQNLSSEKYKEAVKTVKKLIKHLENYEGEKVYNEERYRESLEAEEL